jgi:hypothetical protein
MQNRGEHHTRKHDIVCSVIMLAASGLLMWLRDDIN